MNDTEQRYQLLRFFDMGEGVFSVPDVMLQNIWRRLCNENKAAKVFYSGHVKNEDDWMKFVKRPSNYVVFVIDTKKLQPVAAGWLNNITDHVALSHFFVLGSYRRKMGELVIQYWKTLSNPLVFMGYTPEPYDKAIKLAKILGYKTVGTVPNYCHLIYENKYVPAVVSYLDIRRV